jgi:sugar lactone lactonase YvrE
MYRILLILMLSGCLKAQNVVYTHAGNGSQGFVNCDSATARFRTPFGICADKDGNLIVADAGNNCIRKITPSGNVTTLAGSGTAGYADGPAGSARFNSPTGVCTDDSGNVYVADFQNHRIRKISYDNVVTTIAGSGAAGYLDAAGPNAMFSYPRGICRDSSGNLYVGDSWNHRIRKIDAFWVVTTFAGGGTASGVQSVGSHKDGQDTSARFYTPAGLSIDRNGNIFVADAYNHRIRKITPSGLVSTVAGSGPTGAGNGGFADGNLSSAILNTPTELFADSTGDLYIGDTFNNRVRMVSGQLLTTLAGSGTPGYVNGSPALAQFNYTRGVVKRGNIVYVIDYNNHSVRGITLSGVTSLTENKKAAPKIALLGKELRVVLSSAYILDIILFNMYLAGFYTGDSMNVQKIIINR